MVHKSDVLSLLSLIVGLAFAMINSTFSDVLAKQFGEHTATIIMLGAACGFIVGSQLIRVMNAPAGQANYLAAAIQTLQQVAQALGNSHLALATVMQNITAQTAALTPTAPVGAVADPGQVAPPVAAGLSSNAEAPNTETTATLHRGLVVDESAAPTAQGE